MSATVLGKRTRSAAIAAERTSSIPARAKRRLAINEPSDENQSPFVSIPSNAHDEDETLMDELEQPATKKTRISARTATKDSKPEPRGEASPVTLASHFRVSKASVGVLQDGKRDQEEAATPKTPRHRDASAKVAVTPRHRLLASRITPRSAKTPVTPSHANVYNQARQLFSRCSNPGAFVGRDSERAELSKFVQSTIESKAAGCMYVSGPPGTGKSALLNAIIEEQAKNTNVPVSVVNCMSVRNTKDLSQKLSADLGLEDDAGFDYLKQCFVRGRARDKKKYLVVLDEVDQLVDLDLWLLYNLFEWSMHPTSRLILIGIANALDLTDRFLPRLKARNLRPQLLPFMPYSAPQIFEVITSKLKTLSSSDSTALPFLHPAAIQFCAKKVAAQTGDLRKAFDICKRAIDMVDQETREKDAREALENSPSKTPLMENMNLSSPAASWKASRPRYTIETAPKGTIAHMARVTAQAFSHGAMQRLSALNLQQKAVLCALAALEKRKRETQIDRTMFATPSKSNTSAPSVKQLFEAYSTLCKQERLLHALSSVEFRDVVSGLETLSLVTAVDGKNGSFAVPPMTPSRTPGRPKKGAFAGVSMGDERRVASTVGMKELRDALEGPGSELLKDMLEGNVSKEL